ncbi:MAG: hypothetical protein L0229_18080 [Blastocatellia bacterium]|nr:hypothetical protein [Blastocatellia bacterium]
MIEPDTVLQNRYRIVCLFRQGSHAVYEADDQQLSNTVALKETFYGGRFKVFEQEVRLLAT